jgi:uncharacterized protein YdhG (YjbR/CyaY superfamily)
MITSKPNNIDEYIATFPSDTQQKLQQIRAAIQQAAPTAKEAISYAMPTFKLNGNLVHFAGYKNHIGFYPAPTGIEAFKEDLSVYKTSKGAIQFPLDKRIPISLIAKMVKFRVKKNMEKMSNKN